MMAIKDLILNVMVIEEKSQMIRFSFIHSPASCKLGPCVAGDAHESR